MARRRFALGEERTLADAELDVMRAIWHLGNATARDIMHDLARTGSKVTQGALGGLLIKLQAKGFIDSDRSRFPFTHCAAVAKQQVAKKPTKEVVDKFFDGSVGKLVAHVVASYKLSDEEKKAIRAALADK